MDLNVVHKSILKSIAEKISLPDPFDTTDIDCTELVCLFIFDDFGRTYYNNESLFYSVNNLLPTDIERLKKLRREYPQKVTNNKNAGRRSINNGITYLNKLHDVGDNNPISVADEDEDDIDNNLTIHDSTYLQPSDINISVVGDLCHKIAWLCFTMGYSRSMVQRINFSVLRDNYRNADDFQQIIITSQTILIM